MWPVQTVYSAHMNSMQYCSKYSSKMACLLARINWSIIRNLHRGGQYWHFSHYLYAKSYPHRDPSQPSEHPGCPPANNDGFASSRYQIFHKQHYGLCFRLCLHQHRHFSGINYLNFDKSGWLCKKPANGMHNGRAWHWAGGLAEPILRSLFMASRCPTNSIDPPLATKLPKDTGGRVTDKPDRQ